MQTLTHTHTVAHLRDRLDWLSLEGTSDALLGSGPKVPKDSHRAERRAYMNGFVGTLDAMRAYGSYAS